LVWIVAKRLPDFADGGVDTVLGIEENVLPPDSFDDLIAGHKLTVRLDQESENLHRDFFEFDDMIPLSQLVPAAVKLKFLKSRYPECHVKAPRRKLEI
jgi:hypothetical protein